MLCWAGVVAVAVMGLYGASTNCWDMSTAAHHTFDGFWETLAFVVNALVFMWSGAHVVNFFIRCGRRRWVWAPSSGSMQAAAAAGAQLPLGRGVRVLSVEGKRGRGRRLFPLNPGHASRGCAVPHCRPRIVAPVMQPHPACSPAERTEACLC